ncbi:heme exporter protein CcmD [Alginatibacterium sediminis]|uniref:Heme exporter protein D n=1 Tax=Alginatibacterium sediminis TaxID=2164068 RepID=A0A420EID1_9ALTE|nr:heme exporter protein CcmD [Alginatibacterium sediminis]RKF20445.1 heme exporter protein CcmD [Alginatibacterium sediminis]
MHFDSFSDFLAMGGYAFYVWLAYGISAASLIVLIINSVVSRRQLFRSIATQNRRQQRQVNASAKES